MAEPTLGADALIEQLRNNPDVGIGEIANMIVYILPCFIIALAIKIIAYLTVYGRLIEIVIYSSICPIPMATLMNKEWSDIGKNYIKSMFALGVQGFLIVFIFGIYTIMLRNVSLDFTSMKTLEQGLIMRCIFGVVLCGCLFKAGTISKSILNAH